MKINQTRVFNFNAAIKGMRNPKKSHSNKDSELIPAKENKEFSKIKTLTSEEPTFEFGKNDWNLAMRLVKAGSDHRKFLRQIFVSIDIKAPWYWWRQYHTYKVATVENSTSQMHSIVNRELTKDDFGWEKINPYRSHTLNYLNRLIQAYQKSGEKRIWRKIIQDIPAAFIYTKTCSLNYEVLRNIYHSRGNHKLEEWHKFSNWIEGLPYNDLITVT